MARTVCAGRWCDHRAVRLDPGAGHRDLLPDRRAAVGAHGDRQRNRCPGAVLLPLVLRRRRSAAADRGGAARLRRCDDRSGHLRRSDRAVRLLGTDDGLLLPPGRPQSRLQRQSAGRVDGSDRHHRRGTGDVDRHRVAGGPVRHLQPLRGDGRSGRLRCRLGAGDHRGDPAAGRGAVQVGAGPVPLLASWRHGRADPGQRLPARRRHGEGGRLSGGGTRADLRGHPGLAAGHPRPRLGDHDHRRLAGAAPVRHQGAAGVRDRRVSSAS